MKIMFERAIALLTITHCINALYKNNAMQEYIAQY